MKKTELFDNMLVSVIVPVFNVERYIGKCIDSILAQSYHSIELILIDDGSSDKSGNICDEYAKQDNRITVIHKSNGGISSARNAGLQVIKGDYVVFVDSDDWIDNNYISTLLNGIDFGINAVASGQVVWFENNTCKTNSFHSKLYLGNDFIRKEYMYGKLKRAFYGPVAKLYDAKIIQGLLFDEDMTVGEDVVFNIEFLRQAECVKVIDYIGYNVRSHRASTTHRISLKYTPLYEHGNNYIPMKIYEARKNWGVPECDLKKKYEEGLPMRYYNELNNLFRAGSPYSFLERMKKINIIHMDSSFIAPIKKRRFSCLSNAEKVSWISVNFGLNIFTYFIFWLVAKR